MIGESNTSEETRPKGVCLRRPSGEIKETSLEKKALEPDEVRYKLTAASNPLRVGGDAARTEKKCQSKTPQQENLPLFILNALSAYFFIGPCVVGYWASTWYLVARYIFPSDCEKAGVVHAVCGYSLLIALCLLQDWLYKTTERLGGAWRVVVTRAVGYLGALASVLQWIAVWHLQLCVFGAGHSHVEAITVSVASTLLLLLRCHAMVTAPPVTVAMDTILASYLKTSTFFKKKPGTLPFIPDAVFSVVVVLTLVVSVWKATWSIMDIYVYPGDVSMSGVISLALSYGIALVLIAFQTPCVRLCARLERVHYLAGLVFEDVITLLYSFVAINHWRGYWLLLDTHLPHQPASMWVCHFASFSILALGQASNSIIVRGCTRDGAKEQGEGCVYDMFYLTHLMAAVRGWRRGQAVKDSSDVTAQKLGL